MVTNGMETIRFNMCVNDYNGYGQHTRHLHAVQFETEDREYIGLDCTSREMVCARVGKNAIRVGRRKFPILSYACYVGNIMWDGARITPETANAIIEVLRQSGKYVPTDGTTVLWERWESGAALFATLLGEP